MRGETVMRHDGGLSSYEAEKNTNLTPGATQSDEALLRLCATGRESALQELVRRYQTPLRRFLMRYLNPSDDIEQAALTVFVRAWQNAGRFRFKASVATWLFQIAINVARDLHRSRKSQPTPVPYPEEHLLTAPFIGNAEQDAMATLERQDQHRQIQNALQQMSETDRLLIVLYYFEERTYEEMQEITNFSYKVLKTRISRARQRLRTLLGASENENDAF